MSLVLIMLGYLKHTAQDTSVPAALVHPSFRVETVFIGDDVWHVKKDGLELLNVYKTDPEPTRALDEMRRFKGLRNGLVVEASSSLGDRKLL